MGDPVGGGGERERRGAVAGRAADGVPTTAAAVAWICGDGAAADAGRDIDIDTCTGVTPCPGAMEYPRAQSLTARS